MSATARTIGPEAIRGSPRMARTPIGRITPSKQAVIIDRVMLAPMANATADSPFHNPAMRATNPPQPNPNNPAMTNSLRNARANKNGTSAQA